MNIADLLVDAAGRRPDHPAVIFEDRTYSYSELNRTTNRLAGALRERGIEPGDRVAIFLDSSLELLVTYIGALKAGAVPNVVNGFLKPAEVRHVVNDSEARLLFTDAGRWALLGEVRGELVTEQAIMCGGEGAPDALDLAALIEAGADEFATEQFDPRALANLLYTSGTTGFPKGVMLTHLNVVDNAVQFGRVHFTADDRLLVAAPLFHCWGLINGVLGIFAQGGTAIIVRRFQTEPVLALIEQTRPSILQGVPTMLNYMAKSPSVKERDLSSLRFVLTAAAPMPHELISVLRQEWQVGFAESYGLTETSPVITTTHHIGSRTGSCGRAMGDTVLKVADAEGNALPVGEIGELWAWGTAICPGYFKRPDATAEVFTADGWFKTGDIVRMDAEGYVYLVDRKKDMINVAGEKVYPRDVEELIHRHPAVADAVVVGVPDPLRGEAVKAFIALRPGASLTAEEVVETLKPQLAAYKVPRHVEFVSEVPRSASGKALRRLLRD